MANLVPLQLDRDTGNIVATQGIATIPPGFAQLVGYTHTQTTPNVLWTIDHMGGSINCIVQIFEPSGEVILSDRIEVVNNNTIRVIFGYPQIGKAQILLFVIP